MLRTDANGWQFVNGDVVAFTPAYSQFGYRYARDNVALGILNGMEHRDIINLVAGETAARTEGSEHYRESRVAESQRMTRAILKEWC